MICEAKKLLKVIIYIICPPGVFLRGHSGAYHFLEMDDDAGLSEATFGNQPYKVICNLPKIYMELIVSNFLDLMVLSHFKSSPKVAVLKGVN